MKIKFKGVFYNRIGFWTLFKKETHRFMKVAVQTVLAPLVSNILYLGIFGGMLKTRQAGIEGVNYLMFLTPGLATMGALFAAFQNPAFSVLTQKFQNTIQDLNSYPISNLEKTLAFVLGGTVRGLLVGTLTILATVFFVGYHIEYPFLFFLMLTTVSFIFSTLGLISGLLLNNFEKLEFTLALVITPLAYLGGVFFEISKLPGVLSYLKFINPIYPLVNMTRYAYLGISEGTVPVQLVTGLLLASAIFWTALWIMKKGYGIKTI